MGGWAGNDGRIEFSSILVTGVNDTIRVVHDRMPVIISPKDYELWLGTGGESLLTPYPGTMYCHPVSTYVNNPKNDGKDLIEPKTE